MADNMSVDLDLPIFTIGHSVHALEAFIALLQAHGVQCLVDIRSFPGSRYVPQFNAEQLSRSLPEVGIQYHPLKLLGGRRKPRPDSPNTGWRNAAFRGFADYMLTTDFEKGLQELITRANAQQVSIMCAEAVPWRCHRSLVADALLIRGIQVLHIMPDGSVHPHQLTPFARVQNGILVYPLE
jgi:uncharacterized protein (DUF488 family)